MHRTPWTCAGQAGTRLVGVQPHRGAPSVPWAAGVAVPSPADARPPGSSSAQRGPDGLDGPPADGEVDRMNLATWVERNGRRLADRPAIADGEQPHSTWADVAGRVASVAGGLREQLGLAPGDRVAIVMRNRPEYLEALFAHLARRSRGRAGQRAPPPRRDRLHPRAQRTSAVVVTDDDHADDVESLVGTVASLQARRGGARRAVGPAHRGVAGAARRPAARRRRPGCSTRAAPPDGPRAPRSRTATC